MTQDQGGVSSLIDLNDADILSLEAVLRVLNARVGERLPLEAFRKEIVERFGDAGFKVDVKVWTTDAEGVFAFDIQIQDRVSGQFDPDQMVYETTRDVLGLGTEGFIKSDGGVLLPKSTHVHQH